MSDCFQTSKQASQPGQAPANDLLTDTIQETTGTDCLLVVDAHEAEVRTLGLMLGKLGFEILPALTGAQAFKALASRRPDLILLDLRLPDMTGFEICRCIQEHPKWSDIPIIFFSADQDKNLVVRALESGGVDYITKPFHKEELLSRVRTQLMLKTSRDYAKKLAQEKDEMLGMISHHLQNHLVGTQMSAQFIFDRMHTSPDPRLRLLSENIRSSTSQMRSFLKAFLANAAADYGLRIKIEPVSLTDTVISALQQYEDAARAKQLRFRVTMPGEGLMARADAFALNQVLDNLISNAVKFSPPGKEILVAVQGGPIYSECRIQDHGPGFTDEDKARMFHRYTRLSAQPTGGEPSTGLGLSIVKKLVQAMNGQLLCESAPGIGSTFTVRLVPAMDITAVTSGENFAPPTSIVAHVAARTQIQAKANG